MKQFKLSKKKRLRLYKLALELYINDEGLNFLCNALKQAYTVLRYDCRRFWNFKPFTLTNEILFDILPEFSSHRSSYTKNNISYDFDSAWFPSDYISTRIDILEDCIRKCKKNKILIPYNFFYRFIYTKKEREFIKFLKEHEVFEKFKSNVYKRGYSKGYNREDFFKKYLKRKANMSKSYISSAFVWNNAYEGFRFWKDINDKWEERYK